MFILKIAIVSIKHINFLNISHTYSLLFFKKSNNDHSTKTISFLSKTIINIITTQWLPMISKIQIKKLIFVYFVIAIIII